jgi:hypothetical protein
MRIFIGHMATPEVAKETGVSIAASNFSINLLSGGAFDQAYSILPTFVRGKHPKGYFQSHLFETEYSLFRSLPSSLSFVAPLIEQLCLLFKIPRHAAVWFYNITGLNFFLIKLLKILKPSVKIYVIVLDFTPDQRGILSTINNADGRISLTNYKGISKRNFVWLPGVVPATYAPAPLKHEIAPMFLLSGQLSEDISLISTVVKAFSKIPEATLIITGMNLPAGMKEVVSRYDNVHYLGLISMDKYFELLHHKVTFQLSTRDPKSVENQCNFPSKVIEALLHNLAVVSTIDYPQIEGINYFKIGSDEETMARDLKSIVHMPKAEVARYINQGASVRERFSTEVWNDAIERIEHNLA